MNKTAKLLLSTLLFTSWAKAGLEYDWILWAVDLVVLVVVLSTLVSRSDRGRHFAFFDAHSRVLPLRFFYHFRIPDTTPSP